MQCVKSKQNIKDVEKLIKTIMNGKSKKINGVSNRW